METTTAKTALPTISIDEALNRTKKTAPADYYLSEPEQARIETDPAELSFLATSPSEETRIAVIENPHTDSDTLDFLASETTLTDREYQAMRRRFNC